MQKSYTLNILLAAGVGLASLADLLCRVFLPGAVFPVVSLPAVAVLVLLALVLECYLVKGVPRRDWGMTGSWACSLSAFSPLALESLPAERRFGWPQWGEPLFWS